MVLQWAGLMQSQLGVVGARAGAKVIAGEGVGKGCAVSTGCSLARVVCRSANVLGREAFVATRALMVVFFWMDALVRLSSKVAIC